MSRALEGKKIAVVLTDGFEQVEMTSPRQALSEAGAEVHLIAPSAGEVQGFNHVDKGDRFPVDRVLDVVDALDYDALVIPGGVVNADALRTNKKAQSFVKAMEADAKPLAVICHGSWLLISSGVVEGRSLTSWPSLHDDLRNAGAKWTDEEVVHDANWVSSRKPDDLPAFNRAFVALVAESAEHQSA